MHHQRSDELIHAAIRRGEQDGVRKTTRAVLAQTWAGELLELAHVGFVIEGPQVAPEGDTDLVLDDALVGECDAGPVRRLAGETRAQIRVGHKHDPIEACSYTIVRDAFLCELGKADLAVREPEAFGALVEKAKAALA